MNEWSGEREKKQNFRSHHLWTCEGEGEESHVPWGWGLRPELVARVSPGLPSGSSAALGCEAFSLRATLRSRPDNSCQCRIGNILSYGVKQHSEWIPTSGANQHSHVQELRLFSVLRLGDDKYVPRNYGYANTARIRGWHIVVFWGVDHWETVSTYETCNSYMTWKLKNRRLTLPICFSYYGFEIIDSVEHRSTKWTCLPESVSGSRVTRKCRRGVRQGGRQHPQGVDCEDESDRVEVGGTKKTHRTIPVLVPADMLFCKRK